MTIKLLTAIAAASTFALGCASDRHEPGSPDTSKETEEAVEAVGSEVEEGTESAVDSVQEEVNQGAEEVEEATEDEPDDD